ncbi:hypothetical protein BGY98DRAFT_931479 [Russula aff. rugulosa BPL654]|nr:hypothetical protein BGY98DRAFT_931479 [Russula aff. rugulosa BPL654]
MNTMMVNGCEDEVCSILPKDWKQNSPFGRRENVLKETWFEGPGSAQARLRRARAFLDLKLCAGRGLRLGSGAQAAAQGGNQGLVDLGEQLANPSAVRSPRVPRIMVAQHIFCGLDSFGNESVLGVGYARASEQVSDNIDVSAEYGSIDGLVELPLHYQHGTEFLEGFGEWSTDELVRIAVPTRKGYGRMSVPGSASLVLVAVVDPDPPGCPFTGLSEASTMMELTERDACGDDREVKRRESNHVSKRIPTYSLGVHLKLIFICRRPDIAAEDVYNWFSMCTWEKVHTRSPQQCRTRNFNMDLVIDILYTLKDELALILIDYACNEGAELDGCRRRTSDGTTYTASHMLQAAAEANCFRVAVEWAADTVLLQLSTGCANKTNNDGHMHMSVQLFAGGTLRRQNAVPVSQMHLEPEKLDKANRGPTSFSS